MITHRNRRGDQYYLHEGRTKTGKPKYLFSKKPDGTLAAAIPPGFEVYENPDAQVFLRRTIPSPVRAEETHVVFAAVRKNAKSRNAVVETKGDAIVVFMPDTDIEEATEELVALTPFANRERIRSVLERGLRFSPMMRFVLQDEKTRKYWTERWYCLGSNPGWMGIGAPGPLSRLVRQFCRHLGKESFFELI
jgi:hypothetical protein